MKTKARLKFHARIAHYEADIELVDILSGAVKDGKLASDTHVFDGVDKNRHPRLANRLAGKKNQAIAIGHLYNTICASFIKDIYEDFTAYLSEILRCCTKKGLSPDRLIGEHRFQIEANQILSLGSWDAVVAFVSDSLYRKLENEKSTIKLIGAIDAKLALKLEASIRDAAMPYLDMRHMFVHRDGVADQEFCDKYPQFKLKAGEYIEIGYSKIGDAKKEIIKLLDHIDQKVVTMKLVDLSDLQ